MHALVVGGSVFIGRQLVDTLLAGGHRVAVLDRGRTPQDLPDDLPDDVERIVADHTDPESLRMVLGGREWDAIFDVSGVAMSAGGGIDTLVDLVDDSVGHYVFVSSVMAYDQSMVGIAPWTEDFPTDRGGVRSHGGFAAMVEAQLLARHERRQFPVTIVRPAAVYGPRNNVYDMETPMFLRLLQERPILLPHSGLVTGSYGHVEDLCDAMVGLVGNQRALGEVFNITAGAVTARRYIEILGRIVGHEPNIIEVPDAMLARLPAGVFSHLFAADRHAILSTDKARHLLGYEPRFDIRAGHIHTYRWFTERGLHRLAEPLVDPVLQTTWDFAAESAAMAMLTLR